MQLIVVNDFKEKAGDHDFHSRGIEIRQIWTAVTYAIHGNKKTASYV